MGFPGKYDRQGWFPTGKDAAPVTRKKCGDSEEFVCPLFSNLFEDADPAEPREANRNIRVLQEPELRSIEQ